MKKIINGKVYDSATARLLGEDAKKPGSLDHVEESLYRKRTGEYFLHGSGGARSRYARQIDTNSWVGGEDISPLTYAEARAWAETHMDPDAYIDHFGPVAEDDSRIAVNISLNASIAAQAKRAAAQAGMTLSAYIEQLIKGAQ